MVRVTREKEVKVDEAEVVTTGDEVIIVDGAKVWLRLDPELGREVGRESEVEDPLPLAAPLLGFELVLLELEVGGAERGGEDVGGGSSDEGVTVGRKTEPLLVVHQRLLS